MAIKFYDIKMKQHVEVDESKVVKVIYNNNNRTTYAVRGKTEDGRNLTKFVKKDFWESLDVPQE